MDDNYNNTPDSVPKIVPEQHEGASPVQGDTETVLIQEQPEQVKAERVPEPEPVPVSYTDPNAEMTGEQYNYNTNQQVDTGYRPQNNQEYNAGNNTGYKTNYNEEEDSRPLTMGDWLLTLLALMIPCAGIILYFVWAFSKDVNVNRKNFCRAYLIVMGISLVIGTILGIVFGISMVSAGRYYY